MMNVSYVRRIARRIDWNNPSCTEEGAKAGLTRALPVLALRSNSYLNKYDLDGFRPRYVTGGTYGVG